MSGERQYPNTWAEARRDHQQRYEWADERVRGLCLLDVFCGVGYGSWYLATTDQDREVWGMDGSKEAIDWAFDHFYIPGQTKYMHWQWPGLLPTAAFDTIISLESVEHVRDGDRLVARLANALAPGGTLIFSTPNDDLLPYRPDRWPYHTRHYSLAQALRLASDLDLYVTDWAGQDVYELGYKNKVIGLLAEPEITSHEPGQFTLIAAKKT